MDAATTILAFELRDIGTTRALFAMGAVVIILLILNRSARRRRQGQSTRRDEAPARGETARLQRLRREMEQLVVELNEFAREVNGQLDTRFARLERSIADADRRIAELRRLDGATPREADDPIMRANADAANAVRTNDVSRAAAQQTTSAGVSAAAQSVRPGSPQSGEQRVYELSDLGRTPTEIAQALRCTVGEVELILNLRGRR